MRLHNEETWQRDWEEDFRKEFGTQSFVEYFVGEVKTHESDSSSRDHTLPGAGSQATRNTQHGG